MVKRVDDLKKHNPTLGYTIASAIQKASSMYEPFYAITLFYLWVNLKGINLRQ